jgi:periplasmic protein TonB
MTYHFLPGNFLSRRALAFSGVAAFHVLVAYLLLTALVQPAPPAPDGGTTVTFTAEQVPVPTVDPHVQLSPTVVGQPSIPEQPQVDLAPPLDPSLPAVAASEPTGGSAAVPGPLPVRLLGTNQLPNAEEYYPPDMIRQGVQGATNVRLCVDAQGRLLGNPTVEESSGYPQLDRGALNVVRHGRYARSMQGDVAVGNCFRYRIAFKIPR